MGSIIFDSTISSLQVIDESSALVYPEEATDGTFAVLIPGFGSRGVDNKITELNGPGAYKSIFGDDVDNFTKYGQANLNMMRALRSGSRGFFCNLKPKDAQKANMVFAVAVTDTPAIPQYLRDDTVVTEGDLVKLGTGNFVYDADGNKIPIIVKDEDTEIPLRLAGKKIKLIKKEITDRDPNSGAPIFNGLTFNEIDGNSDTWKCFPLFSAWYYGRGFGGNNYGFKIFKDTGRDGRVSDGRRFTMELFEFAESGQVNALLPEPIYFSFNPESRYNEESDINEGLSYVYQNTWAEPGDGHRIGDDFPIQLQVYPESYQLLLDEIYSAVNDGNADDIDFIFGKDTNNNEYSTLIVDESSIDPSIVAVTLLGGSDGSLELGAVVPDSTGVGTITVDATHIEATKKTLLSSFFTCDVDDDIFDEKIVDADILIDSNWPFSVKRTMLAQFPKYRPDIAIAADLGITYNYREALTAAADLSGYVHGDWDFMVMFNGHSGYTKDPTVIVPRPVTYTYDFVGVISEMYAYNEGRFQMIAGWKMGRTKYVKWNWIAIKNKANMFQSLEKAKVNYIERVNKRGDTMYGTEVTMYNKEVSKLTSFRNALIIGDAQRQCHKILIKYKYDPQSAAASIAEATAELTNAMRYRYPATVGVSVQIYQSKRDELLDNAHATIIFTFPRYFKKFVVTIIARRETSVSETVAQAA
jgi:hypothetical protein